MDGVLYYLFYEGVDSSVKIKHKVILYGANATGREIDKFDFALECKYDSDGGSCNDKEAFRKYLFGITPNKNLDERKRAFQKKIKKISSFSRL